MAWTDAEKGWIAAVLNHGDLILKKYNLINDLVRDYPKFDSFLIDIPIGLQDNETQTRPDRDAKAELGSKASSVFPVPLQRSCL